MEETAARQALSRIGRMMWEKDMVAANDGNISTLLSNGTVLCSPTGVSKGMLEPELFCLVDEDGDVLFEPEGYRVSSEVKVHLTLYRENPGVRAVVHAHPTFATLFAIKGESLNARMLPENLVHLPVIPLAPYATPSTQELARAVAPYVATTSGCLMEQHGALTWGRDPWEAYYQMERLEHTARITYLARLAGWERDLPEDEIARLTAMRRELYAM